MIMSISSQLFWCILLVLLLEIYGSTPLFACIPQFKWKMNGPTIYHNPLWCSVQNHWLTVVCNSFQR